MCPLHRAFENKESISFPFFFKQTSMAVVTIE